MGYPLHTFTAGDKIEASTANSNYLKARDGRFELQANEAIDTTSIPKPIYVASNGWAGLCDANDQDKLEFVGFAIYGQNISEGDFVEVMTGKGTIVEDFTGLTRGSTYYVQDDGTIGTSVGTYETMVGIALDATQLMIFEAPGMQYCGSASDSADVITVPDVARHAIVAATLDNGGHPSGGDIFISRKGKTSGSFAQYPGTTTPYHVTVTASWSGNEITLTPSGVAGVTCAGTAYFYR